MGFDLESCLGNYRGDAGALSTHAHELVEVPLVITITKRRRIKAECFNMIAKRRRINAEGFKMAKRRRIRVGERNLLVGPRTSLRGSTVDNHFTIHVIEAKSSKKNDVNEDENNGEDGPGLGSSVGVEENSENESDGREESEVLVDLSDGDDDDDDELQKARNNLNLQRKIRRKSGINGLLEVLRDIHGIATGLDKTSIKASAVC
ncbi:hypothetical protein ACFE04_010677 [Oxalis oulophora]